VVFKRYFLETYPETGTLHRQDEQDRYDGRDGYADGDRVFNAPPRRLSQQRLQQPETYLLVTCTCEERTRTGGQSESARGRGR